MVCRWLTASMLLACLSAAGGAAEAPGASPEAILAAAVREIAAGNPAAAIATLQALDGGSAPLPARRQADLLLGILLLRQGRQQDAIPPLERAATTYPLLADYALWHLAGAYRTMGQRADAAATLRGLIDKHPDSLLVERASRDLPRDFLEAGDLPRAEEAAGQYLMAFPQGPGCAEAWTTLGEVLLKSGRPDKAEEVLRRVWIELPGSAESQRAKDLLAAIPGARSFTPEEQFQRAMTLSQLGRYGQAVQELAPFATPGNPREAQARLLLGRSAFRLRQYAQAVSWLEPLRDVTAPDRAEAIFWLARAYGRSGDAPRFTETMILVADVAPLSSRAGEALFLLAQAAADNGDPAQARSFLARLLKEYPKSTWADDALWLQGWLAYKARDLQGAVAAWDRLLAEEQGSPFRIQALYWRGRALEVMQDPRRAAKAYRLILQTAPDQHYYWFRAREHLGRLSKKRLPPLPAVDGVSRPVTGSNTLRARKARALHALGLDDDAVEEYSEEIRTHPEDRRALAETCRAFLDLERYDKAVWLAGQILRPLFVQENGRVPVRDFWRCLYPRGPWSLVREQATRQSLDPFLVTALIREESAFAPRAVSRAGARGLMQLMPQTAQQVAREHNLAPEPAPLESPDVNIQLGTIHLADLIRDNGGSLSLAVAGYNAGQQQVRRWRDRFGVTDEEEFTEDIPYAETRNYVKRVLGSYLRYASLYGARRAASQEPRAGR
jgi:soluble lytic murein transglycosylase